MSERKIDKCKFCSSPDLKVRIRNGKEVKRSLCGECDIKSAKNIPLYFSYKYLYFKHHTLDYSIEEIADQYNINVKRVEFWMNRYGVEIVRRCKYCGSKDTVKTTRKGPNGIYKDTRLRVCYSCQSERESKKWKEVKANRTEEEIRIAVNKTKETLRKNPEIEKKRIAKWKETWNNKTDEEMEIIKDKHRITRSKKGYTNNSGGVGIKSSTLFSAFHELLIYLNINFDTIRYGLKVNKKFVISERVVTVNSEYVNVRFLDFYLEINNRQINFEFDEIRHGTKYYQDLQRELEILEKKPILEIYRINEKDYKENHNLLLYEMLKIVQGTNTDLFFDYTPTHKKEPPIIR